MTLRNIRTRRTSGGDLITLPVGAPGTAYDYFIKNVDGLGPVDAQLSMYNFASYDGGVLHNARLSQRNIVLTLGYSPNYAGNKDIGALRQAAYKMFTPKSQINLYFSDSAMEQTYTTGYVEKITPSVFSKDPELQVSVICENPYLMRPAQISLNGVANTPYDVSKVGNAPFGFVIAITPTVNFSVFTIRGGTQDFMYFEYPFAAGDNIRISTNPGSKSAIVTRNGVATSLLDRMGGKTIDMVIDDTVTDFRMLTNGGATANFLLQYRPQWVGV